MLSSIENTIEPCIEMSGTHFDIHVVIEHKEEVQNCE